MTSKRIRSKAPVRVTGGGAVTVVEAFVDDFSLNVVAAESNATPTDDATYAVTLDQAESNAGQTETVSLRFPTGVWGESSPTPTDVNSFTMRVWLSGSAGTGVNNPANANGQNNGTLATVQTAVAGPTTETMNSNMGANIPAGVALTSVILRIWFRSENNLATSTGSIILATTHPITPELVHYSNSGLNNTDNFLTTPQSTDITAYYTEAQLRSMVIRFRTNDAAAGVTPHTLDVDAAVLDIVGAFT